MDKNCTVYKTANFIGKRWTLLILLELYKGKQGIKRYSDLKRKLPDITPKILSSRLKELQNVGLINKKLDSSVMPIRSEYSLTASGLDFIKIIKEIKDWSLKWMPKAKECSVADCKICDL